MSIFALTDFNETSLSVFEDVDAMARVSSRLASKEVEHVSPSV